MDTLLEAGIRPFCTMYHWDLPQGLEDRGGWPNLDLANYEKMGFRPGDERILKAPLDWVGFHYHTRRIVFAVSSTEGSAGAQFGTETELDGGGDCDRYTQFHAEMPTEGPLTDAGLEVYPQGMYDLVQQISKEYNHAVIEITESGCSYLDAPYAQEGGHVPDARRMVFFRSYLAELARAIRDGARVRSYHAWTLLDNFEWADGFSQRYGLTYVDFRDQRRTVKDSGLWYGRVAAAN